MATRSRITVQSNVSRVIQGRIPALGAGGRRVIERILNDVGESAVSLGQKVIATTPSGLVPGKPNRIWTGRMYQAVEYQVTNSRKNIYNLYAGWLGGDPGYFEWQDEGGERFGKEIEGMFMMARIKDFIREAAVGEVLNAIHD